MEFLTVEINVGHDRNDGLGTITASQVHAALLKGLVAFNGIKLYKFSQRVALSNSEETSVIRMTIKAEPSNLEHAIYEVSVALKQDCIAVYFTDYDVGALVGPKSYAWGEFNKDYFLSW